MSAARTRRRSHAETLASDKFPHVSIIRPTKTDGAATGAAHFLTDSGLFSVQSQELFDELFALAAAADRAER